MTISTCSVELEGRSPEELVLLKPKEFAGFFGCAECEKKRNEVFVAMVDVGIHFLFLSVE